MHKMRAIATLVALLLTPTCALQGDAAQQQRARDNALHAHMSTKTKYSPPTRDEELAMQQAERARAAALQCEPVHVNFVIRHGTRYPTIKDITRAVETHAKLRGDVAAAEDEDESTAAAAAEWITKWKNPYRADEAGWLAPVGVTELIAIGNRIRYRFAERFGARFEAARFEFEHTWKPRTQQSASAFAFGFFRNQLQPVFMHVDAIGEDHELRFFDNCPAYDHAIDRNGTATRQHAEYRESAQMRANLRRFRTLARNPTLTQKDLEAAYAACAFDISVWGVVNEWCELFDADMLHSMDYFHDLKHFYKKSHGHALAFEIAAPLLQDMFRSMKERIDGQSALEGHFRFAHAETILPLASLLNVSYFDRHASDAEGHFLSSTPLALAKTRAFQAAKLAPFAANIGFVLYECAGETPDSATKTYRVATLLNERHVTFRECGDELLCPFDRMQTMFRRWIHEYDFHEQCHV